MALDAALLSLVEKSSLLFFIYNKSAERFSYANEAFRSFFDVGSAGLQPAALLETVHPDDQNYLRQQIDKLAAERPTAELEIRFVRGGNQRTLRINAWLSKKNGEDLIMGHAQDISLVKAHNQVLNEHSNKKNSILNILTHDLAGPIGSIGMLSELIMQETAGPEQVKVSGYLDRIKKISSSCIRLIRDFLNQEFLESSGVQLIKRRVNLAAAIKMVAEEYQGTQEQLGIHIKCDSGEQAFYAEIDEDKFLQVIHNLVSNALKFTPDGGTITLNVAEENGQLVVSVADTGIGIPEKHRATLFDKFSGARRNGLHGEHSTGLGMSIIKTIVEWHGGKVWFESEENKGTIFYISVPKT